MQIGSVTALVEYAMTIMFFMMVAQFGILQLPRALPCLTRASEVLAKEPSITDVAQAQFVRELPEGEAVGLGTREELFKTCPAYKAIADSHEKSHPVLFPTWKKCTG